MKETWEQLEAMVHEGVGSMRASYNQTKWWPVVDQIENQMTEGHPLKEVTVAAQNRLGDADIFGKEAWWPVADQIMNWALSDRKAR